MFGADAPKPPSSDSIVNEEPAVDENVPSSNVKESFVRLPATEIPGSADGFAARGARSDVGAVASLQAVTARTAVVRITRRFIGNSLIVKVPAIRAGYVTFSTARQSRTEILRLCGPVSRPGCPFVGVCERKSANA